ncbi:hypothetical protein BCF55_1504 [Hydrogenivirga caldilitoris]|uniref:Uncharacterized protein n=1 Tax=Hydrogenivirga caldilitoris TaxID=246264 RepID=A0A497XQF6_9AQUI|nr:hypothetical protein [Hydrogenivirga caldilitoris]RLJ71205.1 hypothetical protein BCF55_1504 [Hydrogenivirga caldilitoris]
MDREVKEKFERLAQELKDLMANPDIDIEVCFKDIEMGDSCDIDKKIPYVKVKYITEEHDVHEKDIEIAEDNWSKSVEELKEYVTFMIEQFMEEIDSVEYGGE